MTYCIFSDLRHYDVKGSSDHIGKLHDIYLDDETWKIKWFVVETGNWFSSNKILIDGEKITSITPQEGSFQVSLTKKDVEDAPSADEHQPVSDQHRNEFSYIAASHNTLLFPGYAGLMMPATLIERPGEPVGAEKELQELAREQADRHLRSASEIEGYTIHAADGKLGPLSDMVINTEQWTIDLLAVDTSKWLPGRTVVISPRSIDRISWEERELMVGMEKETIEESPELHDLKAIETSYVSRLNDYYRFPMVY
ncbi:PRC-barrel domain-containing protein [Granulosicoccus sp. 3-233]|uniref:PRC-barrel domain-containing protein n=1 Tax=Granulosicoccus sp. 3-233 TaxID=3417969 RepID=UPI003D34AFB9